MAAMSPQDPAAGEEASPARARKRRADAEHDGRRSMSPSRGEDAPSDGELEEQLSAHAALAHNDFVGFFHRRASEEIARNRTLNVRYLAAQRRHRKRYPVAASSAFHDAMQNLAAAQTSEWPIDPGVLPSVTATFNVHNPTGVERKARQTVMLPRLPELPNLTMWTALAKNYSVDDEPQLRFLPYFGDDDDDDVVSEFYQIKLQGTSACEVEFTKEMCEQVLQTLQSTWDLKGPDLKRVAHAIDVEEEVIVEVYKRLRQSQRAAKKKRRLEALAAAEAAAAHESKEDGAKEDEDTPLGLENTFEQYEKAADSYRSLFCRRCYVYDCDYHGCGEIPKLEITEQNAVANQTKDLVGVGQNCGNQCFLGQMGSAASSAATGAAAPFSKASAISATFGWDAATRIACARAYYICSGNYCEVAKILGDKTCAEVAEFCTFHEINHRNLTRGRNPKRPRKKKPTRVSISHLQIPQNGDVDAIQTKIEACSHAGSCEDNNCSCIEDGVFCSKQCNCVHEECKIFFQGCRCARGRCRTKACPCFAAGRECDLDLCSVCCAEETAALMSGGQSQGVQASSSENADMKEPKQEPQLTSCQNRSLALGKQKHMHLARSTMADAGWGLFTGEFIAKDEFIIEYIGEMVTQEEAERRGAIYDKVNRSYLFNLDTKTVIDSTRKGNKTRFINHSKRPNCYCKIINVNSDFRIGLFALRDIPEHTELFFDYRYDKEMYHTELLKTPTVTTWMKSRPMPAKRLLPAKRPSSAKRPTPAKRP